MPLSTKKPLIPHSEQSTLDAVAVVLRRLRDDYTTQIGDARLQSELTLEQVENFLSDLAGQKAFDPTRPQYPANSVVEHLGAVWLSVHAGSEVPGTGAQWLCLLDAIRAADIEADRRDPYSGVLTLSMASGRSIPVSIPALYPRPRGPWSEATRDYRRNDSTMDRGNTYLCLTDNPKGRPSESHDWRMVLKRGSRGSKGPQGDPPPMEEILRALQDSIPPGGIPMLAYRGLWQFNQDYRTGDCVTFENSLFLADEDVPASFEVPSKNPDRWTRMLSTHGASKALRISEVIGQTGF